MVTTRFTPLNWTVTFRVRVLVLFCALDAVTVIAQRPAVSSTPVLNVPSWTTGSVCAAGAEGEAGGFTVPAGDAPAPPAAAAEGLARAPALLPRRRAVQVR